MNDQRCGTCRWWHPNIHDTAVGKCSVPIPASMFVPDKTVMYASYLATDCPCYERKEANESNSEATD